MKPLRDLVVIELDPLKTKSEGGVDLPDDQQEKPVEGVIKACGPKVVDLKPGDRVRVSQYAGDEHSIDGATFLVCKEANVLMILDREFDIGSFAHEVK